MSVDFPRGWQIARSVSLSVHDELCSYRDSGGGMLCDCHVLMKHPEVLDDVLQTTDGVRYHVPGCRPAAGHRHQQRRGPERLRETTKARRLEPRRIEAYGEAERRLQAEIMERGNWQWR